MKFRKLIASGVEWSYHIGRSYAVLISPEGKRSVVELTTLTGRTWETIERGRRKETADGMVTPADVEGYILAHLQKEASNGR